MVLNLPVRTRLTTNNSTQAIISAAVAQ
jgi:hypothetical protein